MALAVTQPSNINYLSPLGFKFTMNRLPNIEYFAQSFEFPLLSLNETNGIQTPFNKLIIAGDHLTFDYFSITFKIDENMQSYFEIFDWMVALGKPDSFDQYSTLVSTTTTQSQAIMSDADLIILNSTMEPNLKITFLDCLPVHLSGFKLDSTADDVQYLTATAEFKCREYSYTRTI